MADTAFTVKVDDKTFVLDRITLGDWRMFKTEFGLKASDITTSVKNADGEDIEILNLDDPNVLIALIVASLRHERPHAPIHTLIAEVEELGMDGLEFPSAEDVDEVEVEAPKEDASAATVESKKTGSSAKPRKKPGSQP